MIHHFSFQDCLAFRAHTEVNPPEGQTNPLWLLHRSSSVPLPGLCSSAPSPFLFLSPQDVQMGVFSAHKATWDAFMRVPSLPVLPQSCVAVSCAGAFIRGKLGGDTPWGWTLLPKPPAQSMCLCVNGPSTTPSHSLKGAKVLPLCPFPYTSAWRHLAPLQSPVLTSPPSGGLPWQSRTPPP